MTIELPDNEIGKLDLTNEQARLGFAVGLYANREVSLGRAAKIAGVPYVAFMRIVGQRGICIDYTVEDAEQDIKTVRQRLGR